MTTLDDYLEGISDDLEEVFDQIVAAREALEKKNEKKALKLISSAEDMMWDFLGFEECECEDEEDEEDEEGFEIEIPDEMVKKAKKKKGKR
jgi:hypothetical protein